MALVLFRRRIQAFDLETRKMIFRSLYYPAYEVLRSRRVGYGLYRSIKSTLAAHRYVPASRAASVHSRLTSHADGLLKLSRHRYGSKEHG
jgi:hypothetical protein